MSFLVVGTECTFLISVQKYIPKFIWSQHEALAVWMKQAECSRVTVFYYKVPAYC